MPDIVLTQLLFLHRVERVYMALRKKQSPYGARAWFAREAHVSAYTVSRWLGKKSISGHPVAVLEQLEHRAGVHGKPVILDEVHSYKSSNSRRAHA